ncbi:MAG: TolC family protein [Campylobacterales bacterium]|nr:TolC family protein [Campylobacterales bacterium]
MKKFNTLILGGFLALGVQANEDLIRDSKSTLLNYSYQKAIEDSSKLKKDWINSATYQYIYNNDGDYTTQKSYISISQPIFKSGGIYSAIKYANAMEKYTKTTIDNQRQELIKQIISLGYELKKLDITISKQKLLIANAKLDIARKKEQVLSGLLDTSFLDNAILDANTKQNSLIDLELQKATLENNLEKISSQSYDQLQLPTFNLVDEQKFLSNNIYIKQTNEDIQNSYWASRMTTANYLPTVNFVANYTKYHDTDNNPAFATDDSFSNVGFNITIPLDVKYSNTIESSKIAYLQKKATIEDQKNEQLQDYKTAIEKVKSLESKITIAKEDIYLYDSLLVQMVEQKNVGMKTQTDVQTMENSKAIKELDLKSLDIDKQLALLEVYYRVANEL